MERLSQVVSTGPLELGDLDATLVTAVVALATIFYLLVRISTQSSQEKAVDYDVPVPEQARDGWKGEILQRPTLKIPGSSAIQCYAPATGAKLGIVNPATADGIDRAILKAAEAQTAWARTTFAERRRVLRTMLKFILENQSTIARIACLDSGKTRVDAGFGEILVTAERLKWTIDHGEKALKPERRPTNFLMMYKKNEVRWGPLGVVAACVSWNYPFHNLIGPIISALFAGNAIVVKGSEQTAWSSNYFSAIARNALAACGYSPQLVQSIICWPSVANYLTSHPGISHLTFIGSREIAEKVAYNAAKSLTPLCLELGGKDAAVVLDDVPSGDIDRVVATLVRGVFQAAGQNCIGIERIVCLPKIYDTIVAKLGAIITSLRPGSALDSLTLPTSPALNDKSAPEVDFGASISSARFDHLTSLISSAVSAGAKLHVGGAPYKHPLYPSGHYFAPTLLTSVTPTMAIAQEELFAPICVVMRATSISSALAIANSTPYGLGASVFGSSSADIARCVDGIQAGMVAVNDFAAYYAVQLPFGGVKGSGYGRFAGEEGLRALSAQKSVCVDAWPGIRTSIPVPLRLPYRAEAKAWEYCKGIVELGYGETLGRRVMGLARLARS